MLVSIITINYNNSDGLEETINSVIYQTAKNYEFIIIDGNSTDNSLDIIKKYSQHITYWVSEPDKGVYDAMNKGIQKSHGEYCIFLNSGDSFSNDNVLEEVIKNGLDADIVCGNAIYKASQYHEENYLFSPEAIKASDLILKNLPHQSSFIRKSLFSNIHLYDTKYKVVSDWLFFIEAILKYNCTYKHINMFVSTCESAGISNQPQNCQMMETEIHDALKNNLPLFYDDYISLREYIRHNNNKRNLFFNRLSETVIGKCIWKAYKTILKLGYHSFKKKYSIRKFYKKLIKEDKEKKKSIDNKIMDLPIDLLPNKINDNDIVVSLTSYGKRVKSSLPYALYSLLTQTKIPAKIVVFLDWDNWSDDKLPDILIHLKKVGVEFHYCEDIKSYKKLIPALTLFPNNPILTVDDDMYYNKNFILWMTTAYVNSDKRTILGQWGCIPEKRYGKYIPYNQWKDCKYDDINSKISFYGVGGCCYPPHIFDEEITKKDIFSNLCPTADDIWFWVMEERAELKRQYITPKGYGWNEPIDRIYDYIIDGDGCLTTTNCIQGKNDEQFQALLDYYHLD